MEEEKIPFTIQVRASLFDEMAKYFDRHPEVNINDWVAGVIYQGLVVGFANDKRRNDPASSPIDITPYLFGKK